jgi:hypothetical protein
VKQRVDLCEQMKRIQPSAMLPNGDAFPKLISYFDYAQQPHWAQQMKLT